MIPVLREFAAAALKLFLHPVNSGRLVIVALVLLVWMIGRRNETRLWPRLGSIDMRADLFWSAFYMSGIFAVVVSGPIFTIGYRLIHHYAPFLELKLITNWPDILQLLVASVVMDFVAYWWHRLGHSSPFFWSFHRIHHSQTELTPLSLYRFHFMDLAIRAALAIIPSVMLGSLPKYYVAAVWIETISSSLAHSDMPWTFGPVGRVFVSPQFHRIHHADEERFHNANYGIFYSFWDFLFGTARVTNERPRAYGVEESVPRSFIWQLADPFLDIARRFRRRPAEVPPVVAASN